MNGITHATAQARASDGGASPFTLVVIGLIAFLTVVDLFATQALLPTLAAHYGVSPSAMGVAVNATTVGMAASAVAFAFLGRRIDRRTGIVACLFTLAVPTALLAYAPGLATFTALRILQGVLMSGAFALTLAHLGERCTAVASAGAFAAYITGNVASNLVGRLIAAGVADAWGLAANFHVFALLNIAGGVLVLATIRPAVVAGPRAHADAPMKATLATHLRNPDLRIAFAIGFLILFAFIGAFTYVNFVLVRAPLALGMMSLGLVYFVFLPSIFTTPLAGRIAAHSGPRRSLWIAVAVAGLGLPALLAPALPLVIAGMVLVACGTFFAQAVATGFVSRVAQFDRGAASSLYLASYFMGGLAGSAVLGAVFDRWGWGACVAGIAAALILIALLAVRLRDNPSAAN